RSKRDWSSDVCSSDLVDYTTHETITDRYRQYFAGAVNFHAFLDLLEVSQYYDAEFTWVEVLGKSGGAVFKTQQFVCHGGRKTFYVGNTVSRAVDVTDLDTFGVGRFVRLRKLM